MAYVKQGFEDGNVLQAAELIAMENGITANEEAIRKMKEELGGNTSAIEAQANANAEDLNLSSSGVYSRHLTSWKRGSLSGTGVEQAHTAYLVSDFVPFGETDKVTITAPDGYQMYAFVYDANKSFLKAYAWGNPKTIVKRSIETLVRIIVRNGTNSTIAVPFEVAYAVDIKGETEVAADIEDIKNDFEYLADSTDNFLLLNDRFEIGGFYVANDRNSVSYNDAEVFRARTKAPMTLKAGYVIDTDGVVAVCPVQIVGGQYVSAGWKTASYTIEADGEYLILLRMATENTSAQIPARELVSHISITRNDTLPKRVAHLEQLLGAGGSDINAMNPNVRTLLQQASKPLSVATNEYLSQTKPLMLLHISDIHADAECLERLSQLNAEIMDKIDDVVATGDIVYNDIDDDYSFFCDFEPAKDYLVTIGNHDAFTGTSGYVDGNTQYQRYIAPNVARWGVTHNADDTYYYKDYAAKNVRLIALNDVLPGTAMQTQLTWLEGVLDGAKAAGYTVVIAKHYPLNNFVKIDTTFTPVDVDSYIAFNETFEPVVQRFIDGGGKFACYICGHYHNDIVARSTEYPQQMFVAIDAFGFASCNANSEVLRVRGERSHDLANIVVIDTSCSTLKIIRIGANCDRYLRGKNSLTINYETQEVIHND